MPISHKTFFYFLNQVFYNAADAICIININGIIQWHNKSFVSLFGYTTEELLYKNVTIIMPDTYQLTHNKYITEYVKTKNGKIIGTGREVLAKHKQGYLFSIYLSVSESHIDDDVFFIGIMHNATVTSREIESKIQKLDNFISETRSNDR